jgi:type IV secretory pathway TraG/TraD family ATPase VirD4
VKTVKANAILVAVFFLFSSVKAQTDTAIATGRALVFADSLLKSFRYNNIEQYIRLSYPGVIKYYGGRKNFQEFILRARTINSSSGENSTEKIRVIQMMNDISEWQCVIEKSYETTIDGKKAVVISYLIGQSKDEGQNWKFFDVAFNSVENVIYIMPDIFDTLAIPQRQVVYEKTNLASKR